MDARDTKEEKNKKVGWLVSVSIQLFLLVLFYFLIAWKAPFPPIPEYGIELGFTTSAGSTQPTPAPISPEAEEQTEEQPAETPETTTPVETPVDAEQSDPETEVAQVEESETPVEAEEAAGNVAEQVEESIDQDIEEVSKPVEETPQTEGSDEAEQVVEEPKIDDRAIYGSQGAETGSSEGASLALAGWIWDFKPVPHDTSDEIGKIVYRIVVDQDGYLVKIETVISTVSQSVERKYRQAVEKLTFSKTSDYTPAALSNGTLTFIIKAR